jgi:hypothetical protein
MTKYHQCYNKNLSTTSPASPKHGLSLGDAPVGSEAHALLMQYSGPGNVRELEKAIEHAIVMGLTDEILPEDLPNSLLEEQPSGLDAARYHNTLNQTKKQLVLTAPDETSGNHRRSRPPPGNPPQIPAPPGPEPEFEIGREATGVSTTALTLPFVDSALK